MKYHVSVPFLCFVTVEVVADSEHEAIDAGLNEARITGFCGNGGADKLIGVYEGSICASDDPCLDFVEATAEPVFDA